MGDYTEIYINVDIKKDRPKWVIDILKAICRCDIDSPFLKDKPDIWAFLFQKDRRFTPYTSCAELNFDSISRQYSLLGKGVIKNYNSEIEQFFEWINPYIDAKPGDFIGYYRHELMQQPILIYYKEETHALNEELPF